jgi:hypothetical protein
MIYSTPIFRRTQIPIFQLVKLAGCWTMATYLGEYMLDPHLVICISLQNLGETYLNIISP